MLALFFFLSDVGVKTQGLLHAGQVFRLSEVYPQLSYLFPDQESLFWFSLLCLHFSLALAFKVLMTPLLKEHTCYHSITITVRNSTERATGGTDELDSLLQPLWLLSS